jgi:hypothetical protein
MFCCDYSQDPEENQPPTSLVSPVDSAAVVGDQKGSQEAIFQVPAEPISNFLLFQSRSVIYFSQEVSYISVQN